MPKLRPLWTPGGRSTNRPPGLPSLIGTQPANAAVWFEDFYAGSIGTPAYIDSGTDTLAYGHPQWVVSSIGTAPNGSVGCTNVAGTTAANTGPGCLTLVTGTGAGDGHIVDVAGRTTTAGGTICIPGPAAGSALLNANAMWRARPAATAVARTWGCGWVLHSTVAEGTNWVADPNTTLLGKDALVFVMHNVGAGAYGGVTAGNIGIYKKTATGTPANDLTVDTGVVSSAAFFKIEVNFTPGYAACYINGTLITTMDMTGFPTNGVFRPSFGELNDPAASAAKTFNMDCYYQECGLAVAR